MTKTFLESALTEFRSEAVDKSYKVNSMPMPASSVNSSCFISVESYIIPASTGSDVSKLRIPYNIDTEAKRRKNILANHRIQIWENSFADD